jgi:hypothetical protein
MKESTKNYILSIFRMQFDKSNNSTTALEIITMATEIAGNDNDKVKEMISDYEFEY